KRKVRSKLSRIRDRQHARWQRHRPAPEKDRRRYARCGGVAGVCTRAGQRRGEESGDLPVQGRRPREADPRRSEKRARGRRLHFGDLPASAFPRHHHYVADRFNFFTIAYNTNLIMANEVPNTYEDLLHPRLAGKVGIEASDVDWFGAIVKSMGEEKGLAFFRKLAAAKPEIRSGHTLMAELVASGEIPLAATIYNHNAERLVVKGAPIRWKALK